VGPQYPLRSKVQQQKGKRKLMLKISETPDGFVLFERPSKANEVWRSLKLTCSERRKKRNWWLGWNGERLARNRDAGLLAEHDPEVYAWVIQEMAKA
jgi:hypothetical protein